MSPSEVSHLVEDYRSRGLFLDTNLLLLLVVSLRSSERVLTHRRLQGFAPEDADALHRFCALFARVVTLPHVLTQASDLFGHTEQLYLKLVIDLWEEASVPSREVAAMREFEYLGLADAAILARIAGSFLVLSDDSQLVSEVRLREGGALGFEWIRAFAS